MPVEFYINLLTGDDPSNQGFIELNAHIESINVTGVDLLDGQLERAKSSGRYSPIITGIGKLPDSQGRDMAYMLIIHDYDWALGILQNL